MILPNGNRAYGPKLFRCPTCGVEEYRVREWVLAENPCYKGEEIGQPVICSSVPQDPDAYAGLCRGEMEPVLRGIRHDLLPESFEVDRETIGLTGEGKIRISSLTELRAIEAESIRRHEADPTHHAPTIFRDFSQNHSNRAQNVFSGTPYERAKSRKPPKTITGGGLPIGVRAIDAD